MAFSLSGSTITQTGTDTNLSGLSGVAGVTTISNGTNTVYNLGNINLIVSGTLTIDPEAEELNFGTNTPYPMVSVQGTLNIGFEFNVGGTASRYSGGTWARFARQSSSTSSDTQSALRVETGGTLNWFGGAMFCKAQVSFMSNSNVTIYSQQAQIIWQVPGNIRQLRMLSSLADVRGLITKGGFVTFIANPARWEGWAPFDAAGGQALSFSSTSPDNVFYVLRDFDPAGMDPTQHAAVWSNSWGRLVNGALGSSVSVGGNSDDNSNNTGLYEIRQELTVQALSFSGGPVSDVKMYMRDTNNGGRLAANQIESNPDYVPDRIYEHTFDATGLHTFDIDGGVLTAVIHRQVGGLRLDGFTYDRRSTLNNGTDSFRQVFCSYLYNIGVFDTSLLGVGGSSLNATLFDDTSITETDKSVVDNYTTLETSAKLYDRSKANLVDIFAGETQTTLLRSGALVDARALNVVLNPSSVSVYSLSGGVLTIDPGSSFTGDLTTTGNVTLSSGMSSFVGDISATQINIADSIDVSNDSFTGQVNFTTASNLLGVTFNGTVVYNDTTNRTITYDGVTAQTVRNDGAGQITILLVNGATVATAGTNITVRPAPTPSDITLTAPLANWVIYNNSNTQVSSGVGSTTYQNADDDTGVWAIVVDRPGKTPQTFRWTADNGVSNIFEYAGSDYLKSAGGVMYTGTTNPLVTVSFDNVTPQATIDIGDGSVSPQEIFDAFEVALITDPGMAWHLLHRSIVTHDDLPGVGRILFLGSNIRIRRENAGDVNASITGYILSTDGTPIDGSNGGVAFVGGISSDEIVQAVWDSPTSDHVILGSFGNLIQEAATVAAENTTAIDNVATQITNLNDISEAQVATQVNSTLVSYDVPARGDLPDTEGLATQVSVDNISTQISNQNDISAADVYAEFTSGSNENVFKADLTGIELAISSLNNISISDVETAITNQEPISANIRQVNGVNVTDITDFRDQLSTAELHAALDAYTNKDDWKADTTEVESSLTVINEGVQRASLLIPHTQDLQ